MRPGGGSMPPDVSAGNKRRLRTNRAASVWPRWNIFSQSESFWGAPEKFCIWRSLWLEFDPSWTLWSNVSFARWCCFRRLIFKVFNTWFYVYHGSQAHILNWKMETNDSESTVSWTIANMLFSKVDFQHCFNYKFSFFVSFGRSEY